MVGFGVVGGGFAYRADLLAWSSRPVRTYFGKNNRRDSKSRKALRNSSDTSFKNGLNSSPSRLPFHGHEPQHLLIYRLPG